MTNIRSLNELLIINLKDLYNEEKQLTKALPKFIFKSSNEKLKSGLESHLEQTLNQVKRLEEIAENMEIKLGSHPCKSMKGIIEEGSEMITTKGDLASIDIGIILASRKIETYEIINYSATINITKLLTLNEETELLSETLKEEIEADKKLEEIFKAILPKTQIVK